MILKILLFTLPIYLGCKKGEASYPNVEIISPISGKNFAFGDTIFLTVNASDNDLKKVTVQWQNNQFITVGKTVTKAVSKDNVTLEFPFILDEKYLESDEYYLRVTAENSENNASDFLRFNFTGLTKHFRGFTVSYKSQNQSQLVFIDSTLSQVNNFYTTNTPRSFHYSLSGDGILWSSPELQDDFLLFNNQDFSQLGSINFISNGPFPAFMAHAKNPATIAAASQDARLYLFDKNGLKANYALNNNYRPKSLAIKDDQLLLAAEKLITQQTRIFCHRQINGFLFTSFDVPFSVAAIIPAKGNEFWVFGNQNGDAKIYKYRWLDTWLTEVTTLTGEEITGATIGSNGTIWLNTTIEIKTFNPQTFLVSTFLGSPAHHVVVDTLENQVALSSQNNLEIRSTISGSLLQQFSFGDSIVNVDVLYNK